MEWLTAIGIVGSAFLGGWGIFSSQKKAAQERKQAYEDLLSNYRTQSASLAVQIAQTEADASSYEEILDRWQDNYNLNMQSLEEEGLSNYNALLSNWADTEVFNAAAGRGGKTAELLENAQKNNLIRYVGSDLKLNNVGGLYGNNLVQTQLDLLADKAKTENDLSIANLTTELKELNLANLDADVRLAKLGRYEISDEELGIDRNKYTHFYSVDQSGKNTFYSYDEAQKLMAQGVKLKSYFDDESYGDVYRSAVNAEKKKVQAKIAGYDSRISDINNRLLSLKG